MDVSQIEQSAANARHAMQLVQRLLAAWYAFRNPSVLRYPHDDLAFDLLVRGEVCVVSGTWYDADHPILKFHRLPYHDVVAIKRYLGWE